MVVQSAASPGRGLSKGGLLRVLFSRVSGVSAALEPRPGASCPPQHQNRAVKRSVRPV